MALAMASELPPLDVGNNSPRSRVGRGLESIGGMTESTFHRLTTVVGGVVKSPVALMAKVGGLASPRALSFTSPTSLEERVFQLEIQMKKLEEKYNAKTVGTELNLSLPKEKPHAARSLLQEMETEGTLVKRVQMLENRLNERMESIEKTLSSIQSQLNTLVDFKPDYQRQESLSNEEYHDAEQQSDNFETLSPRSTGASSSLVKEASLTVEPVWDLDAGKSVLEPQSVESRAVPAPVSVPGDDGATSPASSSERQLASTLEELHEAFVAEPSAAAASAKFLEIARSSEPHSAQEAEPSAIVSSANFEEDATDKKSESPLAFSMEEPGVKESLAEPAQELAIQDGRDMAQVAFRFLEEPSAAVPSAKFEETAPEDAVDKTGTAAESSLFDEDFVMEPLAAGPAQEPLTQEDLSGNHSEPQLAYKFVEEPSAVLPSAGFEELAQEGVAYKSVSVVAAAESPLEEIQEDSVKESLASASSAEPAQELAAQEDSNMAECASSEPQVASTSVEEPSAGVPSAGFEELEDAPADKSATMSAESPLASSLEEDFVKQPLAAEPAQELATQEGSDAALASSEPQVASKFVEEPSAVVPSADFGEPAQEEEDAAADKSATMNAESPLVSSLEEPQEAFVTQSLGAASSAKPAQELAAQDGSDTALASSEPQAASKSVEEPSAVVPSAGFEDPAQEEEDAADDKSATVMAAAESPLAEEIQEDSTKESSAAATSAEPAQELAAQEDDDSALASSEPQAASKSAEEPSAVVPSAGFEEPAQEEEDAADDKSASVIAAAESPLASSLEEILEDSTKESLAAAPSAESAQELAAQEDGDMAQFASSEPQTASKSAEERMAAIPSAGFEEPAQEEEDAAADKSGTVIESPLEEIQEDSAKESLAAAPAQAPATEEDQGGNRGPTRASAEPQVTPKFVEASAVAPGADFDEEPATQEDAVDESSRDSESPSIEETQEVCVKQSVAAAPGAAPAEELATQKDLDRGKSDVELASRGPEMASKLVEEPSATVNFGEPAQEAPVDESGTMVESPLEKKRENLAAEASAQEDDSGNRAISFASLEAQLASDLEAPGEAFVKESSGASEEPAQEKSETALPASGSLSVEESHNGTEEGKHAQKEAEFKVAEDVKFPDEHIEGAFQSDLAHAGSNELKPESLAAQPDSAELLESEKSGEEFFDADQGSGILDAWESVEQKSFEGSGVAADEPGEATGSNQKSFTVEEPLVPALSAQHAQIREHVPEQQAAQAPAQEPEKLEQQPAQEPIQEPEQFERLAAQEPAQEPAQPERFEQRPAQEPAQQSKQQPGQVPEQEPAQENPVGVASEPQVASKFEEPEEPLAEEPLAAAPSAEFEEPAQEPEQQPKQEPAQEYPAGKSGMALADPAKPGEATGINPIAQKSFMKEPFVPAPSVEPAQELAQVPKQQSQQQQPPPPTQEPEPEPAQVIEQQSQQQQPPTPEPPQAEEPQTFTVGSTEELSEEFHNAIHESGHPKPVETLEQKALDEAGVAVDTSGTSSTPQEEPVTTAPTTTEPAQEGENSYVSLKPQLEGAAPSFESTEPAHDGTLLASSESQLASNSVEEPSSGELALESVVDKRLVESPLTPVVEEPDVSTGENEADHKSMEHVQIPDEHKGSIEEALTNEAVQGHDAVLAQPKEALEKKPVAATAQLSELFEVDDAGKNEDSPSVQESEKSIVEKETLAATVSSAKVVEPEKGEHARKRGFVRSSSEPQLAYKLEEHRKTALAKGSSVAAPSAKFEQEDFVDMQCLPFRRLGEGKHVRKESESKSVEDVKSPARKPEAVASYVLEPKTSTRSKEKRKEKKDRRRDVSMEEKESRRHSLGLGEIDRLRMEPDKDGKYSPRTEEKHKQTFRHWRDRLRHAFSVNKDS